MSPAGRPRRGTKRPIPPFWQAVNAALDARRVGQAKGPRTLSDLARACGLLMSEVGHYTSGRRVMPANVEAAIRAALPEIPQSIAKNGPDLPSEETT